MTSAVRDEGPAFEVVAHQPTDARQDDQSQDRQERRHEAVVVRRVRRHVRPRQETKHQYERGGREVETRVPGPLAHLTLGLQSEERRAVQGEQ